RPRWRPARECREPVVRRAAVWRRITPEVPAALRARPRAPRFTEPRMLVRGVVRNPVEEDAELPLVRLGDQRIEVGERAEQRVDVPVIGHVVAEVPHRRAEDRRGPDRVHAEPDGMIEPAPDAVQVADAVAVRVGERARIYLVDDAGLPPPHATMMGTTAFRFKPQWRRPRKDLRRTRRARSGTGRTARGAAPL